MAINLHLGDCMQAMAVMPDNAYDLAIVDPPYKIASQQKRGVGSRIDATGKMNGWNNELPTPEYFKELFRVSKGQIIWGANNYEGLPRSEYFTIWNKEQTVENFASLEYAWVSMSVGKPAKMFTCSIHRHNNSKGLKIHPTMKPVALYKWLLKNYAKPGDKIIDTHGGSMSIAIACYDMGFDLDLWELDEDYYKDGVARYENHKKQARLFTPAEVMPVPKTETMF
jgi:site-specific DNA-methyltransferase (adenine-specific)